MLSTTNLTEVLKLQTKIQESTFHMGKQTHQANNFIKGHIFFVRDFKQKPTSVKRRNRGLSMGIGSNSNLFSGFLKSGERFEWRFNWGVHVDSQQGPNQTGFKTSRRRLFNRRRVHSLCPLLLCMRVSFIVVR